MANYKQIRYGAQGSDVIDLQKKLNQNGYKLDEDGIFGNLTQNAVRDYQQKNNLTANGIVEDNTWGALNKIQTAPKNTYAHQSTAGNAKPVVSAPVSTPGNTGYQPSDAVKQAEAMLKAQMANKPGAYQSPWQAQLDEIMGKIMNREPFSYDLNGDALYQQYKGQAMAQGQQAMMDTMGQAAALTGGYGNSYAQTAGQQAYHGYLQQLNDRIPELYSLALSKYQTEGQDLKDQASMIGAMEAQDYERHQNQVDSFYRDLSYLTDQYQQEREYDYGKFADGRDFAYGMERDQAADRQWEREFEEAKRRYDQAWNEEHGASSAGGSGSASVVGSGNGGANLNVSNPDIGKAEQNTESTTNLSAAGQRFLQNLPYAHAGSDVEGWKRIAGGRLARGVSNGTLSVDDGYIIAKRLGLPNEYLVE